MDTGIKHSFLMIYGDSNYTIPSTGAQSVLFRIFGNDFIVIFVRYLSAYYCYRLFVFLYYQISSLRQEEKRPKSWSMNQLIDLIEETVFSRGGISFLLTILLLGIGHKFISIEKLVFPVPILFLILKPKKLFPISDNVDNDFEGLLWVILVLLNFVCSFMILIVILSWIF